MNISQLSEAGKRELRKNGFCTICGKKIRRTESFELNKVRYGRYILYSFSHTDCHIYKYFKLHSGSAYGIMKGEENGKETEN